MLCVYKHNYFSKVVHGKLEKGVACSGSLITFMFVFIT